MTDIFIVGNTSVGKSTLKHAIYKRLKQIPHTNHSDGQHNLEIHTTVQGQNFDDVIPNRDDQGNGYEIIRYRDNKPSIKTSFRLIDGPGKNFSLQTDTLHETTIGLGDMIRQIRNFKNLFVCLDSSDCLDNNKISDIDQTAIIDHLTKTPFKLQDKNIAICLTKSDQLCQNIQNRSLEYNEKCTKLFSPAKEAFERTGATVKLFYVSSAGFTDEIGVTPNINIITKKLLDPNNWKPWRVEDPLFWVLDQVNKDNPEHMKLENHLGR